jgi:hypothetical protein
MDAVIRIETYLSRHPTDEASAVLSQLTLALDRNQEFDLARLYGLNYEAFELAMALLREWRIDQYFARETGLLDGVVAAGLDRADAAEPVAG